MRLHTSRRPAHRRRSHLQARTSRRCREAERAKNRARVWLRRDRSGVMGLAFLPLGLFSFAVVVGGALWLIGTIPQLKLRGTFAIFEVGFATLVSMVSLDRWGEVFDTI